MASIIGGAIKGAGKIVGGYVASEVFRNPRAVSRHASTVYSAMFPQNNTTYQRVNPSRQQASQTNLDNYTVEKFPTMDFTPFEAIPVTTGEITFDHYMTETRQQMASGLNKLQGNMEVGFSFLYRQIQNQNIIKTENNKKLNNLLKRTNDLQDNIDRVSRRSQETQAKVQQKETITQKPDFTKEGGGIGILGGMGLMSLARGLVPALGVAVPVIGGLIAAFEAYPDLAKKVGGFLVEFAKSKSLAEFVTSPSKFISKEIKEYLGADIKAEDIHNFFKDLTTFDENGLNVLGKKAGAASRKFVDEAIAGTTEFLSKKTDEALNFSKTMWANVNSEEWFEKQLGKVLPEGFMSFLKDLHSEGPERFSGQKEMMKRFDEHEADIQKQVDDAKKDNEIYIKQQQEREKNTAYGRFKEHMLKSNKSMYRAGFPDFFGSKEKDKAQDIPRETSYEALSKISFTSHDKFNIKSQNELVLETDLLDLKFNRLTMSPSAEAALRSLLGNYGQDMSQPNITSNKPVGPPTGKFSKTYKPDQDYGRFTGNVLGGRVQNVVPGDASGFDLSKPSLSGGVDVDPSMFSPNVSLSPRNIRRQTGGIGTRNEATGGVHPHLVDTINEAKKYLPAGWTAKVLSGVGSRPGGSASYHPHGLAADVQIYDQNGNKVDWYQNAQTFRIYEQFAQNAKKIQTMKYPGENFAWGGYFSQGYSGQGPMPYGTADLMHMQWGGPMGGGTFEGGASGGIAEWLRSQGGVSQGMGNISKYQLPSISDAGAGKVLDRSEFSKELQDPAVKQRIFGLAMAEDPHGSPQQIMETIFNRAQYRKTSLMSQMGANYYEPLRTGAYEQALGNIRPNQLVNLEQALKDVQEGSNMSNFALHNASAGVAANAIRKGFIGHRTSSGELIGYKTGGPGDPNETDVMSRLKFKTPEDPWASAKPISYEPSVFDKDIVTGLDKSNIQNNLIDLHKNDKAADAKTHDWFKGTRHEINHPSSDFEKEKPSPGSAGYGSLKAHSDGGGICAL